MPSAGLARFGRASEGTSAASLLLAELLEALGDAMPAGGGGPGAAASASARPSPSSIGITLAVAKFSTAPRLRQNSSYASQLPAQASWYGAVEDDDGDDDGSASKATAVELVPFLCIVKRGPRGGTGCYVCLSQASQAYRFYCFQQQPTRVFTCTKSVELLLLLSSSVPFEYARII